MFSSQALIRAPTLDWVTPSEADASRRFRHCATASTCISDVMGDVRESASHVARAKPLRTSSAAAVRCPRFSCLPK